MTKYKLIHILTIMGYVFFILLTNNYEKIDIESYGPKETLSKQDFNKQPNGESAFWFMVRENNPNIVVILNRTRLSTMTSAKLVSALAPKELYAKPGIYTLILLDAKNNISSRKLKFQVKDK